MFVVVEDGYLLNIDFPTGTKIHLNPPVSSRCTRAFGQDLGDKIAKDGGLLLMNETELGQVLQGTRPLLYNGKIIPRSKISACGFCVKDPRFTVRT